MVAICAYDARKASPGALYGVIDAHPIVLYAVRPDPRLRLKATAGSSFDTTTFGAFIGVLEEAVSDSSDDLEIDLGGIESSTSPVFGCSSRRPSGCTTRAAR